MAATAAYTGDVIPTGGIVCWKGRHRWRLKSLEIVGMSCGHCVKAVTMALQDLPGVDVKDVKVGQALIDADDDVVTTAATHGSHRGGRLHARVGACGLSHEP